MIIPVCSEMLPRRIGNQYFEMTRKSLESFLLNSCLHIDLGGVKKKKDHFPFSLCFQTNCKDSSKFFKNFRISIPFFFKPFSLALFPSQDKLDESKKNQKLSRSRQKTLVEIKKKNNCFVEFNSFRTFFFFLLKNFSSEQFSPFFIDWQRKKLEKTKWKNIEKPLVLRLFKFLSNLYFKNVNLSSFRIGYKRPDCLKQVLNGILQGTGGVYEKLQRKKFEVEKVIIRNSQFNRICFFFYSF